MGFDNCGPGYFNLGHSYEAVKTGAGEEIWNKRKINGACFFYKDYDSETSEGCPQYVEKLVKGNEKVLILTKSHPVRKCG